MPDNLDTIPMCEWFAMCDKPATRTVWHPIIGGVPVCDNTEGGHLDHSRDM